jgi:hypothetical protein
MPLAETLFLVPTDKPLPWKGGDTKWGKRKRLVTGGLTAIPAWLDKANEAPTIKYVVIDDHTHFQNEELLSDKFAADGKSTANKYARWETFGRNVYSSIFGKAKELRKDLTIVLMGHTTENADGEKVFKTFGKMVGNSVDPVSYANVVLHAIVLSEKKGPGERYVFLTNRDGVHEAKSPMGMFDELYVPNDLYAVLQRIEAFDRPE